MKIKITHSTWIDIENVDVKFLKIGASGAVGGCELFGDSSIERPFEKNLIWKFAMKAHGYEFVPAEQASLLRPSLIRISSYIHEHFKQASYNISIILSQNTNTTSSQKMRYTPKQNRTLTYNTSYNITISDIKRSSYNKQKCAYKDWMYKKKYIYRQTDFSYYSTDIPD